MKKEYIHIGDLCNNDCWFCNRENCKENRSLEEIKKDIAKIRSDCEAIVLRGGEPTLHKDFFEILELCNDKRNKIEIITNGRAFYYPDFCKKLKKHADNVELIIKICGPTSQVHDSLTNVAGSFEQTIHGIKNLDAYGIRFSLLMPVTEQNFIFLLDIIEHLKEYNPELVILLPPYPAGRCVQHYEKLVPRYSDIISQLQKMNHGIQKITSAYLPLCILKNFSFCDLNIPFKKYEDKKCSECSKNEKCIGAPNEYITNYGSYELAPLK